MPVSLGPLESQQRDVVEFIFLLPGHLCVMEMRALHKVNNLSEAKSGICLEEVVWCVGWDRVHNA